MSLFLSSLSLDFRLRLDLFAKARVFSCLFLLNPKQANLWDFLNQSMTLSKLFQFFLGSAKSRKKFFELNAGFFHFSEEFLQLFLELHKTGFELSFHVVLVHLVDRLKFRMIWWNLFAWVQSSFIVWSKTAWAFCSINFLYDDLFEVASWRFFKTAFLWTASRCALVKLNLFF